MLFFESPCHSRISGTNIYCVRLLFQISLIAVSVITINVTHRRTCIHCNCYW